MGNSLRRLLSEADQQEIEACVRAAESRTRGEFVVVVAPASHHYPTADLLGATAFALPVAVALSPMLGGVLWAGPSDTWAFLCVLIPLFIGFHAAVRRIPFLKRFFISAAEMEAEVREAAYVTFFRKGLHRTAEETGVLFYVSVFERRVWVIGDRGVNTRVSEAYWANASAGIVQAIRAGRTAVGICRAVSELAEMLEQRLPVRPLDPDELKNVIVESGSA